MITFDLSRSNISFAISVVTLQSEEIIRDSISQLDNIAEHDLDDEDSYDYVIDNSGTYDDLFKQIWDIVNNDIIFKNITIDLFSTDNCVNYLRLINQTDNSCLYQLCMSNGANNVYRDEDENVVMITPVGGPNIFVNECIEGTDIIPVSMYFNEENERYYIVVEI